MSPNQKEKEPFLRFPTNFLWGAAISAHQTEGGNNNQWTVWEKQPGHIKDGSVSGRADDFYHLYEQDLDLAKELGHNVFRFSVEWARIEPSQGKWDAKEVEHYRDVLKATRKRGLEPLVTIHHFTNPLWMEARGGWVNPSSVELFRCYAAYLAEELGDLVDLWGPINEPTAYAGLSYLWGRFPPCQTDPAKHQTVLRHLLLAHGESYHAIHDVVGKNRTRSAPRVGTVKDMTYFQPYDEESPEDRKEAASRHQSYNAAFMDSINTGRISPPIGSGERVPVLKDAWDFIGYNYYFRHLVQGATAERSHRDMITRSKDSLGLTDTGWEIYPQGIYKITKWLKGYGKPLYITENGTAVHDDNVRSMFIVLHLEQVHKAIQEGADVRGYLYWSLIDNFEWDSGFAKRFGIVEVNYKTLKRTPRPSAFVFKEIIKNNGITADMLKKYREIGEHRKGKK